MKTYTCVYTNQYTLTYNTQSNTYVFYNTHITHLHTIHIYLTYTRISILLASIPYALFVLAAGFKYSVFIISSAALLGFGAALLWISHGVCLSELLLVLEVGEIYIVLPTE